MFFTHASGRERAEAFDEEIVPTSALVARGLSESSRDPRVARRIANDVCRDCRNDAPFSNGHSEATQFERSLGSNATFIGTECARTDMNANAKFEQYAHALALFALGVAILGHGMAATMFVEGLTPATVALPLVGSAVAYRSFVGLLPRESSLSADGFLVVLSVLTAGFVNLVGPAIYRSTNVLPGVATPPSYWAALVVGVAGFATLGVYELLADRVGGRYALAKLLAAALVAIGVAVLLVTSTRSLARGESVRALSAVVGAVVAAALFDYTAVRETKSESLGETGSESPTQ